MQLIFLNSNKIRSTYPTVEISKSSDVYLLPQYTNSLFTFHKYLDYTLRKSFRVSLLIVPLCKGEQNICVTNYPLRIHPTDLSAGINLALCSILCRQKDCTYSTLFFLPFLWNEEKLGKYPQKKRATVATTATSLP